MRILLLKQNDVGRVASEQFYFGNTLAEQAEVIFYGPGYLRWTGNLDVPSLVKEFEADAVLMNDFWYGVNLDLAWQNLDKVSVPKAMYPVDDPHDSAEARIEWYNKNGITLLCSPLIHEVECWKPKLKGPELVFLPHSVRTDVFVPLAKVYDAAFLGETWTWCYPFRHKIKEFLKTTTDLKGLTRDRPAYSLYSAEEGERMRRQLAFDLGSSKMFIFDVSIWRRPYLKFLEALSCGALPLAPIPHDVEEYHLEPDKDFAVIDENNFPERIRWFLKNEEAREQMIEVGRGKVIQYHDMRIRVKEVIKKLEEYC